MLVLTRRNGEEIVIGDNVVLTVVECHRDAVRIGIQAPRETAIRRGELLTEEERKALEPPKRKKKKKKK